MPSSSETTKNQWNIIWTLALPDKIRIFAWRATKNLLPSAKNLWKRRIIQEPVCQVCKIGLNVFHALVDFKAAKNIQKLTHLDNDIKGASRQDILSLLHGMNRMRSKADLELIVKNFWVTWNARNQLLFKGKKQIPRF